MSSKNRRQFLSQVGTAGLAWATSSVCGQFLSAQTSPSNADALARVYVDSRRAIGPLDRNLFGSFLEHLGRAIYEGIYDPGSKLSDANGFRKDVMDEIRQMNVPIIRYPGGNFVSSYNWLDGVGPKEKRPRVLDKAWNATNTNQVGTNEFMVWCKAVGTLPLMGLNFGTGSAEDAANLVEYCNVEKGTKWSDLRRSHGVAEPYKIKNWCLGNEMDGPWQVGHMTASEYGLKAQDAARQMHYIDPSLRLIACGSSGPGMPTYLEWDREVLENCYEYVDALSLHRYIGNTKEETGEGSSKYLAMNRSMDITLGAEYYSKRGWSQRGEFRARPSDTSFVDLDYFGIDCALDAAGRLVVFEVNASMLVHDQNQRFPYKTPFVQRIKAAFDAMLRRLATGNG